MIRTLQRHTMQNIYKTGLAPVMLEKVCLKKHGNKTLLKHMMLYTTRHMKGIWISLKRIQKHTKVHSLVILSLTMIKFTQGTTKQHMKKTI